MLTIPKLGCLQLEGSKVTKSTTSQNDLIHELLRVCRDLTATQAPAEESTQGLKLSHQQSLDIIEFLPDATLVIDEKSRVIAWNQAMEEMTGLEKREILGKGDYLCAVPFSI
jgi:PAS domain-containing protein